MFFSGAYEPFLWNAVIKDDNMPHLPISVKGELNFNWHLAPSFKPIFCHKDIRNVLFVWIKSISRHRQPPKLPGEFRMNYAWQMVLSNFPAWRLVISYYLSWANVYNMLYLFSYIKDWNLFLSLQSP